MATPSDATSISHISHGYVVFISIAAMMTLLSTISVTLRFISRRLTQNQGWDDWAALGALVFAYGFLVTTVLVSKLGDAGYHITEYTAPVLEKYLQIALANNIIYNASIVMSKTSIILFYRRIFVTKAFLISTQVVSFFIWGAFFAAEFGLLFSFNPVQAQWKFWLPHTSIHQKNFWLTMGIVNILLDVVLLTMPQTLVWKLHLSKPRKVQLSLVFLLGGFVCVTSIVRIISLETINVADATYTLTTPGIWTLVEMHTSIICASLPMLPALLKFHKDGTRPNGSKSGGTSGASLFRSMKKSRKESSYTDLEGPELSSTGLKYHASIVTTDASNETVPMKAMDPVRVQRDFEVAY